MERVRIRFGRLDPHLLRPLLFLLFLPHQASIKLLHLPPLWLLWQAAGIMLVPDPATIPSSALKQATPLYSSDQWLFLGWPVHLLISVLLMRPKLSPLSLLSFLYIRLACCVLCVDIVSFPLPVFRVRRLKAVPRAPASAREIVLISALPRTRCCMRAWFSPLHPGFFFSLRME